MNPEEEADIIDGPLDPPIETEDGGNPDQEEGSDEQSE